MKGFCNGSSIEIDLELDESEISKLEREVINSKIRRAMTTRQCLLTLILD